MNDSLASLIQTRLTYKTPFCLSLSTLLFVVTNLLADTVSYFTPHPCLFSPCSLDLVPQATHEQCVCLGAVSLAASVISQSC